MPTTFKIESKCGCSSKSVAPGGTTTSLDEDVALSVASGLAQDDGGVTDQVKDIAALTHPEGLGLTMGALAQEGWVAATPTYNVGSSTWEWGFTRDWASGDGQYSAHVTRTYQWQFRKRTNQPQIAYIVGHDTAYTIEFTVIDGTGRHATPHLSQALTDLSANLVATGTNGDLVTVNGTCSRGAVDTIFTHNAVRSLDHHTDLTLTEIHFSRSDASNLWESVSGTITGTFHANITVSSGDVYDERSVNRNINVTLGNGQAAIHLNGHAWSAGLRYGELR